MHLKFGEGRRLGGASISVLSPRRTTVATTPERGTVSVNALRPDRSLNLN